jgi:hypothetical protein
MWELDKKTGRQISDASSSAPPRMVPGKSTLASQLPVVHASMAPNRDVDRPAPEEAKPGGATSALPRLDLGKSTTSSPGEPPRNPGRVAPSTAASAWTPTPHRPSGTSSRSITLPSRCPASRSSSARPTRTPRPGLE